MNTPVKLFSSKLKVKMQNKHAKKIKESPKKKEAKPVEKIKEATGGVPIHKFQRGELPAENTHFTSYRVPLDLANAVNRIAQKEDASMNDVVVAMIRHGVAAYGPVRGYKSDLKPSLHSRQNYGKKAEPQNDDEGGDEGESTPTSTPVRTPVKKGTAGLVKRSA